MYSIEYISFIDYAEVLDRALYLIIGDNIAGKIIRVEFL